MAVSISRCASPNPQGGTVWGGRAGRSRGSRLLDDGARFDGPMDLLYRFHHVDPGKRQAQRGSDAFDRGGGANDIVLRYRRKIERLAPENRRENCVVEQFAQLRPGVWRALAERRAVGAGPYAAPGGHDDDHASLRGRHAPRLFQQRLRPLDRLERVRHEETINGSVRQRKHVRPDERGCASFPLRPHDDPLLRGHQRHAAVGAATKPIQIRQSISERRDRQAGRVLPARAYDSADNPSRHLPKRRAVKFA